MPDELEWIDHSQGGGCPLQGETRVRVRFRDGMVSEIAPASTWWNKAPHRRSLWIHNDRDNDIMAFWVVNPELRAKAIKAASLRARTA